jgi:hypothetical protein
MYEVATVTTTISMEKSSAMKRFMPIRALQAGQRTLPTSKSVVDMLAIEQFGQVRSMVLVSTPARSQSH